MNDRMAFTQGGRKGGKERGGGGGKEGRREGNEGAREGEQGQIGDCVA